LAPGDALDNKVDRRYERPDDRGHACFDHADNNARQNPRSKHGGRPGAALLHLRRGDCVTTNTFDPEAAVDSMASLVGLTLQPESRTQTIVHLRIASEHAQKLLSVRLDDQEEPAPVFTA
jgi:hypothetical protein